MNDSDFPCCLPWVLIPELSWVILYFCDYDFLFLLLTFLTRSLNHSHSPLSAVLLWDVRPALGNGILSSVPCIDIGWYLLWEPCSPVGLHINSALTLNTSSSCQRTAGEQCVIFSTTILWSFYLMPISPVAILLVSTLPHTQCYHIFF